MYEPSPKGVLLAEVMETQEITIRVDAEAARAYAAASPEERRKIDLLLGYAWARSQARPLRSDRLCGRLTRRRELVA